MGTFRILSFDGGGLKGLISLGFLERISAELGGDGWIGKADMLAGTSTGGLIALSLADGKSVADVKSFYENDGPRIFNRRTWTYFTSLMKMLHIGYENKALSEALDRMFAGKTLDQLEKKVLISSFDLSERVGKRRCWAPKIFNNFEGPGQDKHPVRDVALYTSAAPTYLPGVDGFIDGGVCANNPSMCALAQVLNPEMDAPQKLSDVRLISIGTGVNPESVRKKRIRWGVLGWNVKILSVIMDGSVGIADYQCRQLLSDKRYLRLQMDLKDSIAMDDAREIPKLGTLAGTIDPAQVRAWAEWIGKYW